MIDETMRRIERRIRDASDASDETREELLRLLGELRRELEALEGEDRARAVDVVDMAHRAGEADSGLEVERAVGDFEAAHPRLMATLQSFFRTLSDAGL